MIRVHFSEAYTKHNMRDVFKDNFKEYPEMHYHMYMSSDGVLTIKRNDNDKIHAAFPAGTWEFAEAT